MFEPSLYQPLGNHLAVARNGTTQSQVQFSTEYPVTRIETIADGTINFGKVGYLAAPAEGYELQPGDILYSHINSIKHVGKVAQYFGEKKTLYHGMNLLLLRLDDEVDKRYLFHYLNNHNARHYAQKECQKAINQVSLNTGQLKKLSVFTPPLSEQRLIAHILDALDTQIQKTEALITKLEKVKEGLLHDLLTRGIDENGRLRPSPEQAPELYKESPLGLIPRQWEVKRLGGLIDGIDAGWSPSCSDVVPKEGEWGVLKVSAISTGAYLPHKSKTLPEGLSPIKEIEVNSGDVICVRANGVAELVGRTAYVFSTPRRLMLSDKTLRLRAGEGLDPLFLFLLMGSASTRKQIASFISGSSGQKNLSQNQINSIQVKAPSIEEQRRVAGALSSMASRIEKEKSARDSSATLKAGLMGDLLTGRVRVTPLLEKAQATSPA
ncbi:restriction endonuclease subunit S [Halomonas sp. JS92-SW72]|uniref:restriction endonuclease subunit S n=1 Tax=Halomonas sp. JS92-SW72 TaxID=2306583 RepID=UPI0013C2BA43|nr:restriction endonuclease subunit S [Halomonas sp. JS92-SW72]